MRLWSDTITAGHIYLAVRDAGPEIRGADLTVNKSWNARNAAFGHDVSMSGWGARHTRYKNLGTASRSGWGHADSGEFAATWMDWGWVLAVLFRFDPKMRTAYYDGRGDFLTQTAAQWPRRRDTIDKTRGAGDFARTYAARLSNAGTLTGSPFELVDEVCPPVHLVDFSDPDQVRTWLANDSHLIGA